MGKEGSGGPPILATGTLIGGHYRGDQGSSVFDRRERKLDPKRWRLQISVTTAQTRSLATLSLRSKTLDPFF
ncbi:hypothetical protein CDL15_Pgr024024 [Punica granatum]|uniref:Uncharacterized protein n=1 Tax=Punica granatum TaxID=22663 RepID=A0A218XWI2_PUNGR|nr:hypothetical protein CDL15_Pgr024024 [Punica granatum]